jgi:hypothetical protein
MFGLEFTHRGALCAFRLEEPAPQRCGHRVRFGPEGQPVWRNRDSVIAITAFRRGECWAWWVLLVGNTVALLSAMTYDMTVSAIGPLELTEYLGLALVWGALAVTAPFRAGERPVRATA